MLSHQTGVRQCLLMMHCYVAAVAAARQVGFNQGTYIILLTHRVLYVHAPLPAACVCCAHRLWFKRRPSVTGQQPQPTGTVCRCFARASIPARQCCKIASAAFVVQCLVLLPVCGLRTAEAVQCSSLCATRVAFNVFVFAGWTLRLHAAVMPLLLSASERDSWAPSNRCCSTMGPSCS